MVKGKRMATRFRAPGVNEERCIENDIVKRVNQVGPVKMPLAANPSLQLRYSDPLRSFFVIPLNVFKYIMIGVRKIYPGFFIFDS